MRTLTLIASAAMLAAAEQPKPALNNAETIALRSVVTESKKLDDQQKQLKAAYEAIIADACQRVFGGPGCRLNDDGTLTKVEPAKEKK
jgi:hypothetical protein